jgi:hypothetical protein
MCTSERCIPASEGDDVRLGPQEVRTSADWGLVQAVGDGVQIVVEEPRKTSGVIAAEAFRAVVGLP